MADSKDAKKLVWMSGKYKEKDLLLTRAIVREGLSKLTETTIEFMSKNKALDLAKIVGYSMNLHVIGPKEEENKFSGLCVSVENLGPRDGVGHYIAEVKGGSKAKVIVSAEVDGKQRKMGEFEFRVKDVPAPVATIAGTKGGLVSANRLAAAPTVIPKMENFDFELFFKVTKFDLVFQVGTDLITKQVTGSKIPAGDLNQIKRLKKGSRVYIENIKAVMLDENNRPATGVTPKDLSPVSLKIR